MRRQVLIAFVLLLAGMQAFASDGLTAKWLQTAQNDAAASDCRSECKVKFESCKADCYSRPDYTVDHKEQCTRVCDQTFNFICVRRCN